MITGYLILTASLGYHDKVIYPTREAAKAVIGSIGGIYAEQLTRGLGENAYFISYDEIDEARVTNL